MHPNIAFGMGELYMGEIRLGAITDGQMSTIEVCDTIETDPIRTTRHFEPIEFEMETMIDTQTLGTLIGEPKGPSGFTVCYDGTYLEQARRHKKKRINKKWAKRYGYREVPCTYRFNNARLSERENGAILFETYNFEIIKRR